MLPGVLRAERPDRDREEAVTETLGAKGRPVRFVFLGTHWSPSC